MKTKTQKLSLATVLMSMLMGAAAPAFAAQANPAKASPAAAAPVSGYSNEAEGVTATEILVGRSGALTGINKAQGLGVSAAIRAYFEEINEQGGIHGRKLKLVEIDDEYDIKKSKAAANELVKKHVFAALMNNGTGPTKAALPIYDEAKIPLIGSTSGNIQRGSVTPSRYFFNVRNSNYDDLNGISSHLATLSIKNVAVVYQDDEFGRSALSDMEKAAFDNKIKIVARVAMPAQGTLADATKKVKELYKGSTDKPEALIALLIDKPMSQFIQAYKSTQNRELIYTITSAGQFEQIAGMTAADGVIVSQSFPPIEDRGSILSIHFGDLMAKRNPTFAKSLPALEGFMAARVFVEGLKAAGPNPTREGLVNALETFKGKEIEGIYYNYSTPQHTGTSYNELLMWDKSGRQIY